MYNTISKPRFAYIHTALSDFGSQKWFPVNEKRAGVIQLGAVCVFEDELQAAALTGEVEKVQTCLSSHWMHQLAHRPMYHSLLKAKAESEQIKSFHSQKLTA